MGIGLRALVLCALLSFLIVGVEAEDTSATADPAAARALSAITDADFDAANPRASFPSDWQARTGYWPAVATGPEGHPILIKPDGDCSSFFGDTAYRFDLVCKEHDLAYDVLRYSVDVGWPLPAASRKAADAMFQRELHNQCTYSDVHGPSLAMCHVWAESFAVMVEINSWRQGYRPPVVGESVVRWDLMILLFVGLFLARRMLVGLERDPFLLPAGTSTRARRRPQPSRPAAAAVRVTADGSRSPQ